ncbi:hydroxyisourate hydrolase [Methylobacterium oryzae]|uniref:5-hydroxyisourate hydrolase n=1 Tax=Methylobacterium oryzae TaxID=334852 RepID=A0ABU7TUR8_9HYPH
MRRLTTHVLDLSDGRPAAGVGLRVCRLDGGRSEVVATAVTNADGRCDRPLLSGEEFTAGPYEIQFDIGAYFARRPTKHGGFLDIVPIRFVATAEVTHLHVPLLVAPFGYSTYRGS